MCALRLSVLDQSPVPSGSAPAQAIANSISLARHVDALGYHRFWMSEHHAMPGLAGSAPEILLARIGAETSRIRVGSGGIMLPHYSPFKVAEVFSTLEALYPNRVDLGLGRAPGGGPIENAALRRIRIRTGAQPDDFPAQVSELITFLYGGFAANHPFSHVKLSPATPAAPQLWLLGSSMWSAEAAAAFGLPYAFAHFFASDRTRAAIEHYQRNFQPNADLGPDERTTPQATAAVGVICAQTDAEAERLALPVRLLQQRIRQGDRRPIATPEEAANELAPRQPELQEFPRYFVGTPDRVRAGLIAMAGALHLDELIINTITHDHKARLRSYDLLAQAFDLTDTREYSLQQSVDCLAPAAAT